MRTFCILIFASLLLLAGCDGDNTVSQATAVDRADLPQAEPDRIRAHVSFLADDLLKGRDTGSEGYAIAARYVAAQFTQMGIKPAGDKGSYFQNVPFRQAFLNQSSASLVVHSPAGDQSFHFRDEFVASGDVNSTESSVSAPLVFVGYGIESDWLDLHDYEGLDVKGKIVVALSGKPEALTANASEEAAHFSGGRHKYRSAAERGAVGFISITTPVAEKVRPFASYSKYLHMPSVSWLNKEGKPAHSAPEIKGRATLSLDASRRLFELAGHSLDDVFNSIEKGELPKGFDLPISATLQQESRHESIHSPNIVGIIEGSDPSLKDEYVSFTAHLDHIGLANNVGEDNINNGALDNAAGVAALLENARLLMQLPKRPRRSILFVIVTAEEKGLLGSEYFATNPTVPVKKIVANINLDMPILLFPFNNVIAFGAQHSSLKGSAERALAKLGLGLMDDPMPEQAIFVRSDHYRFVQQGVPALFLSVGFESKDEAFNGEEIWMDFLHHHYHQVSDDLNQPIDYDAGALFAQVNFMIGNEVANAQERPQWNEGDFFATFASEIPGEEDQP